MSRAWIAFYMGDYNKDTEDLTTLEHGAYFLLLKVCWTHGFIPLEPERRAAIAKMTLKDWNKVAPRINVYFDEEGRNKRATKEIEKADVVRLKRAVAGHLGGKASGIAKAIRNGQRSKREANAKRDDQQNPKPNEATLRSIVTSSEQGTARASPEPVEKPQGLGNEEEKTRAFVGSPELVAILAGKKRA